MTPLPSSDVKGFRPGDCVAALSYGSFSEYGIESARTALPVPCVAPELVALLTRCVAGSWGGELAVACERHGWDGAE